jgi:LCP family protein required for cell wall assembly
MFVKKNLHSKQDIKKQSPRVKTIAIRLFVLVCIVWVGYAWQLLIIKVQAALWYLGENTIDIVSDTFGKPMLQDSYGNVNVLLVWVGGESHDGGMLADAIIVASWNPKTNSIVMVSIPRDLYVDIPEQNIRGRINQVFSSAYYAHDRDLGAAATILAAEVEEITGIDAKYYAVVDFNGFKNVIDMLWGIDIDVPERIYDSTYPNDANRWYTTFHIERWLHHMDGDTALKYARSRHSSSDFARSQRQQQIIEATIKELLRKENIHNVSTIKRLYEEYTKMVTTNVSNQEIIGMIKHVFNLEHVFNFGLTSVCSNRGRQVMEPGCFLYTPDRERFGGASVLLPNGSTYSNFGFYDYTRNFGHIVAQNQEFLVEWARIKILNGIDKAYAQAARKWTDGHATQIATKLRRYGFTLVGAANADATQQQTTAIIYGDQSYSASLAVLKRFFPLYETVQEDLPTTITVNELGEELVIVEDMWVDIVIILGNDYIDARPDQFNYNM